MAVGHFVSCRGAMGTGGAGPLQRKNPALIYQGRVKDLLMVDLAVSFAPGCRDPLSPQCFALFAAAVFAGLFIAFLELQTLEKSIVLNLFFQDPHGFLKVVVMNPDRDFLQTASPLSFHPTANDRTGWLMISEWINNVLYAQM
jgi:hypothetical protein